MFSEISIDIFCGQRSFLKGFEGFWSGEKMLDAYFGGLDWSQGFFQRVALQQQKSLKILSGFEMHFIKDVLCSSPQ